MTDLEYIDSHELTETSYVKLGNNSRNLIISFGSVNRHGGFDRKTSLLELREKHGDVDLLYMRDTKNFMVGRGRHRQMQLLGRWYLGGLTGIGKNINHTISFIQKIVRKYTNVICIGTSMGGYASILFGSLLSVNHVIVGNAQTDLEFVLKHTYQKGKRKISRLSHRKKECPATWNKFANLCNHLNESVNYQVYYSGDHVYIGNKAMGGKNEAILHSTHHLNNISSCPTVKKFNSDPEYSNFIEKTSQYLI